MPIESIFGVTLPVSLYYMTRNYQRPFLFLGPYLVHNPSYRIVRARGFDNLVHLSYIKYFNSATLGSSRGLE